MIWEAFWFLNGYRERNPMNGSLSRIALQDIASYCDLHGIVDGRTRQRLLRGLAAMDSTYLNWISKNG